MAKVVFLVIYRFGTYHHIDEIQNLKEIRTLSVERDLVYPII